MIGINRVRIENFQSHADTVLEFTRGLNVIVGPSDQGKSAILRAIKWVLYNRPRGLEFIRHGTSSAKVSVELSNGYTIIRERSSSKNRYIVVDAEGNASTFEGFGNDMPEEVIKAHGIPEVMLDTDISSSLNISDQLEGPFLLCETGAVRAKAIGRLTGLHIIDKAIRDCIGDLRKENQLEERLKKELQETNEKLEQYEDLHILEQKINSVGDIIERLSHLIEKKDRLERLKEGIRTLDNDFVRVKDALNKLRGINECEIYLKDCELKLSKLNSIASLSEKLSEVRTGISSSETVLSNTGNIDQCAGLVGEVSLRIEKQNRLLIASERLKVYEGDIRNVETMVTMISRVGECESSLQSVAVRKERLERLESIKAIYHETESKISEGNSFYENNAKEIDSLVEEYAGVLKKDGKCPVCGSEISEHKLKDIIKHSGEVNL